MRTSTLQRTARQRLLERRCEVLVRCRLWDDAWIRRLPSADAHTLLAIFEALRRLDHGTYGLCVRCDAVIDADCLARSPERARCEVCELFDSSSSAIDETAAAS